MLQVWWKRASFSGLSVEETVHAFAGIIESGHRVDIFDSGASRHMTPHLDRLSNFRTTAPHQIRAAENGGNHIRLKGVLHAPKMHATLISLGVIEAAGFAWIGYDGHLYRIFYESTHASLATSAVSLSLFEIHKRLGHVNYGYLKACCEGPSRSHIACTPVSACR